jgi:structure-specific recognition protein 1
LQIPIADVEKAYWAQFGRSCRLSIHTKAGERTKFDGFRSADSEGFKTFLGNKSVALEDEKVAASGSNWGVFDFVGTSGLAFNSMDGKCAMELELNDVSQCALPKDNEIELQFGTKDNVGKEDHSLVEMRIYVPKASGDDMEEEGTTSAVDFQQMILDRAGMKSAADAAIIEIEENSGTFLTPRGKYAIEMYKSYMRMHGKTYDYKILYKDFDKFFYLAKPDRAHVAFVISLTTPIRQGQQRYQHLVMQMSRDQTQLTVNLTEEELKEEYGGKLKATMDGQLPDLVAKTFKALTGKPVYITGKFRSYAEHNAVKCSLKANEGHLYPLNKSFIFIHKPTTIIAFSEIKHIEFQRYQGMGSQASRTFDVELTLKSTSGEKATEISFTAIERNEYDTLFNFINQNKIRIINPKQPDATSSSGRRSGQYTSAMDLGSDDDDEDEDDDSDFDENKRGSDSDQESGSGSDDLSGGGSSDDDSDGDGEKKEKKKKKEKPVKKVKAEGGASPVKRKKATGKKKKDPNAPKRALSAYMIFSGAKRAELKETQPDLDFKSIATEMGKAWREVEDKSEWDKKAAVEKARYDKEMEAYKPPAALDSSDDDAGASKSPKKKARKDPNAPKKNQSAYMHFGTAVRPKLREENPEMKMTEISKLVGAKWKECDAESRKEFDAKAAADKAR